MSFFQVMKSKRNSYFQSKTLSDPLRLRQPAIKYGFVPTSNHLVENQLF